ncbi:MAG TPA: biotin--[acetyl-CoA-carboxylase] ligase [Propionibacteriaceae bacterium]
MDVDPIEQMTLARELVRPDSLWSSVEVVAETGSTNADLAARARAGAALGSVLVTDFQSAGRGRQGRVWTAPAGTGIAMSVLVRPDGIEPSRWTWLPLLTGLAVSDGLRQAVDLPAVLKWPNDVLVLERKICGILAERVETPTGPACVIGMGLNVTLGEADLPVPTATSVALALAELGADGLVLSRTTLVTHILVSLGRILTHWSAVGQDQAIAVPYLERCTTIGRSVRVLLAGDRSVDGVAESIDPDGRLVVRTPTGPQTFGAGDVIHLR